MTRNGSSWGIDVPTYEYVCERGHDFERVLPVSEYKVPQVCDCGQPASRILSVPKMAWVQQECRYDSPIDGRPITSYKQRRDDMARNGCREYDPEMRKDADRRAKREAAELEQKFDRTIEQEIERMPVRKKERLQNELSGGASINIERSVVK